MFKESPSLACTADLLASQIWISVALEVLV